jgi:23S rRNA (guanosine2251-2'-O)-methyltransferase
VDDELLLEGRNAVLEALKSGREVQRVYMARGVRGETINQIWELARANGVLVQEQERDDLDRRSATGHHQGVLATLAASPYASFEDVLNAAKAAGGTALVLVLDGIQDPENLGALVRTADAANVTGVIVPNRRSAGLTAVVAKAAAGALMYVPVARVSNLAQAVEQLKSVGLWIVAAEASGEKLYTDADLTGPLAVVIGGEGKGVGPNLMSRCDFTVKMPMHGHVNSLNASVAGGVLLYEVLRQRSTQNS